MAISEKELKKIGDIPLFAGVERALLLDALDNGRAEVRNFCEGEILFTPASEQKCAGLLLSGKAAVSTPDASKSTLLRYLAPGELFGIASLFSDEAYISVIRADTACRVLFLSEAAVRYLLERDAAFMYRYLTFLTGRIRYLNRKIGYLTAGSAERRLALYLVSFGTPTVHLSESISALSELLDVGRASLYRAFDKLTDDGFIQKEGRSITLPNPDGMLAAYQ